MPVIRPLLVRRHLAVLLCVAALLLKLLVPAGYMIGDDRGRITIAICSGTGPMTIEIAGVDGTVPDHGRSKDHGQSKDHGAALPCAFSGLSAAVLGATDPVLLATLIAFVVALGRGATVLPAPSRPAHLRPPLRGPPATL